MTPSLARMLALDPRAFAYYDVAAKKWTIAPGNFGILVGQSSADIALTGSVTVSQADVAGLQ